MAGEIFISYRRADEVWARMLHAQLRSEVFEAWYDAHVAPGEDWRIATAKALGNQPDIRGAIFPLMRPDPATSPKFGSGDDLRKS